MVSKTIQQSRTVIDSVGALECDLCSEVFSNSTPTADAGTLNGFTNIPAHPEGSGIFLLMEKASSNRSNRKLDLCPACAGVTWDWLQERKR